MYAEFSKRARIASFVDVSSCEAGRRVFRREGAEERRDRQLALAVDAGVRDALLVDLELEPRAAARHEVRREDLLRRVLGLHQVGARRADELRDDHALGAVDDERAVLGHHREVAHEDRLLADLARVLVDEPDGHRERGLIGQVLLTAFLDRELGQAELVLAELDGERAGVILDRRDVVDGLPEALVQEPLERGLLDVDQIGEVEDVFDAGKGLTRAGRSDLSGQRKSLPWGRCGIQAIRACRSADERDVGATCQDTDWTPVSASERCGGSRNCRQTVARRARSVKRTGPPCLAPGAPRAAVVVAGAVVVTGGRRAWSRLRRAGPSARPT